MSLAEQTFTIQTEGVGIIELTAELSSADPTSVALMQAAKTYIDTIDASIGQKHADIELFNTAIMSTEQTFTDTDNVERLTWQAMEDFADASNYQALAVEVASNDTRLNSLDALNIIQNTDISALETAQSGFNSRLVTVEAGSGGRVVAIGLLNTLTAQHTQLLNAAKLTNDQQDADIIDLVDGVASFSTRMANAELTYADHNVLLDGLEVNRLALEERVFDVESVTDAEVQVARFIALEDTDVVHTGRLDGLDTSVAAEATARASADTTIQGNLNAYEASNDAALASEAGTRASADTTLQANIDGKVSLAGNQSIAGINTFTGDVTVEGLATLNNVIIKSQSELDVGDAIVLLNADEDGVPSIDGGIEVERGTSTNAQLVWDESEDKWAGGLVGSITPFSYEGHTHAASAINSGTFANARIAAANVTQHQAALTITESQVSDLGDYVDLTTTQTIGGDKTFTGATTRIKAASGHTFVVADATSGSQGQLLFREAGTSKGALYDAGVLMRIRRNHSAAGTNTDIDLRDDYIQLNKVAFGVTPTADAHLTTKAYVENNFVADSGGTMSGDLVIAKTAAGITLNSTGTTWAPIRFRQDGVDKASLYLEGGGNFVGLQKGSNGMIMRDTHTTFTYDARISTMGSHDDSVTTKDYVGSNFVDKTTAQTIAGEKTFSVSPVVPDMIINDPVGTNPTVTFQHSGVFKGVLYANASQLVLANTATLRINTTYATFDTVVRGVTPVGTTDLTTKGYVEDNFVADTGGDMSGNLSIAKTGTALLTMNTTDSTNTYLRFSFAGATKSELITVSNRVILRYKGAGDSDFSMYDGYAHCNKTIRAATPVDDADLTRKDYVNDNFVGKDTNAEGTVLFQPPVNNDWRFYSTTAATNLLRFHNHDGTANVLESWINAGQDAIVLRKFDASGNNDFSIRGDYTTTNKTMRAATPLDNADLTTKAYVDDNTNVVQQASAWSMVMPSAAGTVGQQLQVGSVSGTVVTMVWV